MKIFTAICGLILIASCEAGAKAQSNQSASGLMMEMLKISCR